MTDTDLRIVKVMVHYGGSFAKHIGMALMSADDSNFAKVKAALPELWRKYEEAVVMHGLGS